MGHYRCGCYLIIGKRKDISTLYHPIFAKVLDIILVGGVAYFAIHRLNILHYLEHCKAYEVINQASSVSFVHPSSLLFHEPLTFIKVVTEIVLIKPRIDLYPLLFD